MNYENFDYLTETVFRKFGIEGEFDKMLEEKMKQVPPPQEIQLKAGTAHGENTMEYLFNLEYKGEKERYFLNSIDATITRKDGTTETQRFNLYNQTGLNIEQMHNVMEGRFAWREYQKWDKEQGQSVKQSGWFFKDENRLDEQGKPMIRVLNDQISKFNLVAELSKVPLNISQQEKNQLLADLKQGKEVSPTVTMPDGKREKASIIVHPQKGLQVFNMKGEKVRFQKANSNVVVMDPKKDSKISSTTAKLIEKGQQAAKGEDVKQSGKRKIS